MLVGAMQAHTHKEDDILVNCVPVTRQSKKAPST